MGPDLIQKYHQKWAAKKHGQGVAIFVKGSKYVGQFKNNKRHGQGKYTHFDGKVKEGIWKEGKFLYENKKSTSSNSNSKLDGYKNFCAEIGFTPGTEKFGECVLKAMEKG